MSIADDHVYVQIGDREVRICKHYDITLGVFEQPSTFALTLGTSETVSSILKKFPKNSPFQILIGHRRQFAGYTAGVRVDGDEDGSQIAIHGSDIINRLYRSFHEKDASYVAQTHEALVQKALDELEMERPFGNGERPKILASNTAAREARVGAPISAEGDTVEVELANVVGTAGNAQVVLRAKLGERWLSLLQRHLRQNGLFVWGSQDGDVIIGRPNYHQPPSYRIVRTRGRRPRTSNVRRVTYVDDLDPRYSEVAIYGRATGRKYARTQAKGAYTDDELVSLGINKRLVLTDVEVTSTKHAEFIAKRHLAEGRREGFFLEYRLAGHTTFLYNGGGRRVCWAPDTIVEVHDEELNLEGNYWIERVRHERGPDGSYTTVRLLPPDSLIFGEDA